MTLDFDQIFYGRGARGYAVLGSSPGAAGLASRVEALCGGVGTPGGDYGGEPFLLSVPEGRRIIMVCGRRGAPDSMGRGTLLFHALVAERADLDAAEVNAFSLFEQGIFSDRIPAGAITPLRLDLKSGRSGSANRSADGRIVDASLPCVFRSDHPAPELVRAALGSRANDYAWATFAFQALPRFSAQVLPPRVTAPAGCGEYDDNGILLRAARTVAATDSHRTDQPSQPPECTIPDGPEQSKPFPMLKLSFAANIALAVLCAVLFIGRKPPEPVHVADPVESSAEKDQLIQKQQAEINRLKEEVQTLRSQEQSKGIDEKAIADYIKSKFPDEDRITAFEAEKSKLPKAEDIEKDRKYASAKEFLRKAKAYVDFVNNRLINPNPENNTP